MIRFLEGDATDPIGDDPAIIAHICNNVGKWGSGFTRALDRRWPAPREDYLSWNYRIRHEGGHIRLVEVDECLWVANMVAQKGVKTFRSDSKPLRLDWIEMCLHSLWLAVEKHEASVHMPRIGCGLAGGSWDEVEPVIESYLAKKGVEVFVYDLPTVSYKNRG